MPAARYFKDTNKVMDVESRLVHCMMTLQGFTKEEATKQWFSKPGKDSDIEALVTYIGAKSNGMKINVPARHPEEARWPRWASTSSTAAAARRISPAPSATARKASASACRSWATSPPRPAPARR
jgi:hypothetical protein